ncbi:MAG: GNAT family N-acetyltransferase [archaeon]|jgi:ribosomal protein S18 acetylase RimI-like enzyme
MALGHNLPLAGAKNEINSPKASLDGIIFGELSELNLNTISEVHALFPHWKKSSVQKKLSATIKGIDKRFVALENGRIVAHVKVVFGKGLHKHRAEISSLVVESSHRRHRIGIGLMEFTLKNLPGSKTLVLLAVDSKNKPAILLYKKLGFSKYGLLKKAALINEKYVDNCLMKKEL